MLGRHRSPHGIPDTAINESGGYRVLGPNEAFESDCPQIQKRAQGRRFVKAFAVIESPSQLDVAAVYTAAGDDRQVRTLDVEPVPLRQAAGGCPDLVVDSIFEPESDGVNRGSLITASIRHIGTAPPPSTIARIVDPSTPQPGRTPYSPTANTPALNPDAAAVLTFHLPYWVYNPDLTLEVTADYKTLVQACTDDNNNDVFQALG